MIRRLRNSGKPKTGPRHYLLFRLLFGSPLVFRFIDALDLGGKKKRYYIFSNSAAVPTTERKIMFTRNKNCLHFSTKYSSANSELMYIVKDFELPL